MRGSVVEMLLDLAEITHKAGLIGITEKEINNLCYNPHRSFVIFDIGIKEPYSITGVV